MNISGIMDEDMFMKRTLSRPFLVAVKILRKNAEERARYVHVAVNVKRFYLAL